MHTLRGVPTEVAVIIFSILTALALEDWHQRRQHRELASEAIGAFRAEILHNWEETEGALLANQENLEALSLGLKQLRAGTETSVGNRWSTGIRTSGAWESALATQALTYMPYEKAALLSSLYTGQKNKEDFIHDAVQMEFSRCAKFVEPQPLDVEIEEWACVGQK